MFGGFANCVTKHLYCTLFGILCWHLLEEVTPWIRSLAIGSLSSGRVRLRQKSFDFESDNLVYNVLTITHGRNLTRHVTYPESYSPFRHRQKNGNLQSKWTADCRERGGKLLICRRRCMLPKTSNKVPGGPRWCILEGGG